jgi:hypothetical protein
MRIRKDKLGLDAIKTPSDLDIAWAAGIYEGEGSCIKSGNSFGVSVAQKDPEILYRLRDLFGGSVKEYPNDRGTLANNFQHFTLFAWRICGDREGFSWHLTARRKSQIDATSVRVFLDLVGNIPREGSLAFVNSILVQHVAEQLRQRKERRKTYQDKFYEQRKTSDPTFMQKRREMTAAWRKRNKVVEIA